MNILEVAEDLIKINSRNYGSGISIRSLHCLLYYCQGYSFGWYGDNFFNGDFEAWDIGVISPTIHEKYKSYGRYPIKIKKDIETLNNNAQEYIELLEKITMLFGRWGDDCLLEATTNTEPWLDKHHVDDKKISDQDIKKYFIKVLS